MSLAVFSVFDSLIMFCLCPRFPSNLLKLYQHYETNYPPRIMFVSDYQTDNGHQFYSLLCYFSTIILCAHDRYWPNNSEVWIEFWDLRFYKIWITNLMVYTFSEQLFSMPNERLHYPLDFICFRGSAGQVHSNLPMDELINWSQLASQRLTLDLKLSTFEVLLYVCESDAAMKVISVLYYFANHVTMLCRKYFDN